MSRKQTNARSPSKVDKVIGLRIREKRKELGWSQTDLGDSIGVTFQQIQKVERGSNRIAASRLYAVAKAFKVSMDWFVEGAP